MVEATWGTPKGLSPEDWHMSAALEDVPRGNEELAEVTSLEGAVRAWMQLDPELRASARLTLERPVMIGGLPTAALSGEAISALVQLLPEPPTSANQI